MRRPIENAQGVDISGALTGWSYQPGEVNVRLIRGNDGRRKIQLRLDLGLLQMETTGRPDGKRPHNCASELDYQLRRKRAFERKHESAAPFLISHADVRAVMLKGAPVAEISRCGPAEIKNIQIMLCIPDDRLIIPKHEKRNVAVVIHAGLFPQRPDIRM